MTDAPTSKMMMSCRKMAGRNTIIGAAALHGVLTTVGVGLIDELRSWPGWLGALAFLGAMSVGTVLARHAALISAAVLTALPLPLSGPAALGLGGVALGAVLAHLVAGALGQPGSNTWSAAHAVRAEVGSLAILLAPAALTPVVGLGGAGLAGAGVQAFVAYRFRRRLMGRTPTPAWAVLLLGPSGAPRVFTALRPHFLPGVIVHAEESPHQEIVLTRTTDGALWLFLDGQLQFSSTDEASYHRGLVEPAFAGRLDADRVLVLGGGDGLAARDLLRRPGVSSVTLVDLDATMTAVARRHPELVALNQGALLDRRVHRVHMDAGRFVRTERRTWPAILADLPDPDAPELAHLYQRGFYREVARRLEPGGVFVTQATSAALFPERVARIRAEVEAAGLRTTLVHAEVPSFGGASFVVGTAPVRDAARPYAGAHARAAGLAFLQVFSACSSWFWTKPARPVRRAALPMAMASSTVLPFT